MAALLPLAVLMTVGAVSAAIDREATAAAFLWLALPLALPAWTQTRFGAWTWASALVWVKPGATPSHSAYLIGRGWR